MEQKKLFSEEHAELLAAKLRELNEYANEITGHKFDIVTILHPEHVKEEDCHGVAVISEHSIGVTGSIVQKGLITVVHHFSIMQKAADVDGMTKQ